MRARPIRGLLAGAVLALAATTASAQVGVALMDSVPTLTVEGEATREVAPDTAVVTLGVSTDRATAAQAADDNNRAAAAVVAAARDAGLAAAEIQTSQLQLAPVTDATTGTKPKAYRATNLVTLRAHDPGRVGALIGQVTAQGANAIEGIGFTLSDEQPVMDDLRGAATRDAIHKAGLYAAAANLKLGRILRIAPSEATAMPMARGMKLAMAAGVPAPPVEAGAHRLESRVQVTWELIP